MTARTRPAAGPKTRTRTLRPLLHILRAKGADVPAFLRRFELPEGAASDEETMVSLSTLHEVFEAAEGLAGDPFLGLHMALQYQRGTMGLLEYTFRLAPTLGDAYRRVVRYVGLTNDLVQMAFEEGGGRGRVRHFIPGHSLCLGRHLNEYFVTLFVLQVRHLSGVEIVPDEVWFAHPRPPEVGPLVEVFGTSALAFGAESNGVAISAADLALPVSSADPTLLAIIDGLAEKTLAAIPPVEKFSLQVRRAVRERMSGTVPELPAIAAVFHMSERTFQRRLGDEGTNFQNLVDSVREELARLHMAEQKLSLGEIAYLLGYAEHSAFLRAFKRWTGVTPQRYRAGAAPAPAEGAARPGPAASGARAVEAAPAGAMAGGAGAGGAAARGEAAPASAVAGGAGAGGAAAGGAAAAGALSAGRPPLAGAPRSLSGGTGRSTSRADRTKGGS
ncbi:MAG TPA: AraC family transcriptional regulator [Polyangiaceae bacterium]|nr:AraC family transcriptional regulator [Polyangiaceae bacterium]